MLQKFFADNKYALSWGIGGVLILSLFGSAFLIVKIISEIKSVSESQPYYNSISITGEGEVLVVPNVSTFSFTVNEASESVDSAQKIATEKVNKSIEYLKSQGIEEKDIKTSSYNINPKYEWRQMPCAMGVVCEPGKNILIGYEVFQNVDVKVRDVKKAGELLAGLGKIGISNISGLEFKLDDDKALKEQARALAIEDANRQIKDIAKNLKVKIGKVVGFYEESPVPPVYGGYGMGGSDMMAKSDVAPAPELPTGENKIVSRITINFELK